MPRPDAVTTRFTGRYLRVDEESWPGLPDYEVVHQLGAAAILPITPSGDALLVRQFRPPVADDLLEIPAGLLDVEGEDAMTCAVRELREETGFGADTVEFLGGVFGSPTSTGWCTRVLRQVWQDKECASTLARYCACQLVCACRSLIAAFRCAGVISFSKPFFGFAESRAC